MLQYWWEACRNTTGRSTEGIVLSSGIRGTESSAMQTGGAFPVSTGLEAEIWAGDERRKFQALESGDSLNGRNLFTELPFL